MLNLFRSQALCLFFILTNWIIPSSSKISYDFHPRLKPHITSFHNPQMLERMNMYDPEFLLGHVYDVSPIVQSSCQPNIPYLLQYIDLEVNQDQALNNYPHQCLLTIYDQQYYQVVNACWMLTKVLCLLYSDNYQPD